MNPILKSVGLRFFQEGVEVVDEQEVVVG